jgi:nucleotide-binding universal stress UspA family protein
METQMQTIIVPTDFTQVGGYAIKHAVKYSKILNKDITLLHIIKKEADYEEADCQIKLLAEETKKTFGVKVQTLIREGSIFSVIGEVSNELNAEMVIMGTHGMQGMQKVMGSWALKVIVTAHAPFIIVQGPPKHENIDKLVFPVDFKKEDKEKIGWACFIANLYSSKIYVYKSNKKDKGFLNGIIKNMAFVEKCFKNKGVNYEITMAQPKKNFANQTIEYATKIDADLILIMTTKAITYADYVLGAAEQNIIANEAKIPVMCLNPRPTKVGSFSATGN